MAKEQHGFIPKKSVITNLLMFNNFVSNSLNSNPSSQVDVAYIDFKKAFDSIDHAILMDKLKKLNLNKALIDWLLSYISKRSYRVLFNHHISNPYIATSGVPQGSHLGPLLFIIFINDITLVPKNSSLLIYADDVKIFRSIKNLSDSALLQQDITALNNWATLNNLPFNIPKCKIMTLYFGHTYIQNNYTILTSTLKRETKIRDLGIIYNNRFNFEDHIQMVVSSSRKKLGILKYSSKTFKNTQTLISLYKSLIQPILLFGSIIWSPQYRESIYRLQKVQNNFLRHLAFKDGNPMDRFSHNYTAIIEKFKLPNIEAQHKYNDILFIHKCIHSDYLQEMDAKIFTLRSMPYPSRRHFILDEIPTRSNEISFSTTYRLRSTWNNLNDNLRQIDNTEEFSTSLKLSLFT